MHHFAYARLCKRHLDEERLYRVGFGFVVALLRNYNQLNLDRLEKLEIGDYQNWQLHSQCAHLHRNLQGGQKLRGEESTLKLNWRDLAKFIRTYHCLHLSCAFYELFSPLIT